MAPTRIETFIAALSVALPMISIFAAPPAFADFDNLPPNVKLQYKEEPSYLEICRNYEKIYKRDESKVRFKIIFKNKLESLPDKFGEAFPKSYNQIVPDGLTPESSGFQRVLIVFPSGNEKLKGDIDALEIGKPVIVFATMKTKMYKDAKKKDADSERLYVLLVEDVDSPGAVLKEDVLAAKDADFEKSKFRRVDIQYDKFLDKKVRFDMHFKDIDNRVPQMLTKLSEMTDETHFALTPMETFHTPILVARDNERCVEPLIDAKPGDRMSLCGVLRKADDPSAQKRQVIYFFYVYSLSVTRETPPEAGAESGEARLERAIETKPPVKGNEPAPK